MYSDKSNLVFVTKHKNGKDAKYWQIILAFHNKLAASVRKLGVPAKSNTCTAHMLCGK